MEIAQDTIDELVHARQDAQAAAGAFGDAIKEQAKKYKIKKGALRKYITAIADDKVEDVRAEAEALTNLIG